MNSTVEDRDILEELGLDETEAKILKAVMDKYDEEDKAERDRLIRMWKELELFFRGIQTLLWDDVSRDWIDASGKLNTSRSDEYDPGAYDKVINIYRAHLESIIAAVTANVPRTKFFPEDADNPDDIKTAKTSVKVVEKIERDNSMSLKFIHALYIMVNQGLVFSHTYYHHSNEYGTIKKPVEGLVNNTITNYYCEYCANQLETPEPQMCPNCEQKTTPESVEEESEEIGTIDEIESPKGKACIEIYGPLHVKIPINLTSLRYTPYLRLETDQHIAYLEDVYPHLRGKINEGSSDISTERKGRNPNPTGTNNENQETLKMYWLRPWALNIYGTSEREAVDALKERFPGGLKVCSVSGHIASIEEENIDDYWTATESPLSNVLHNEPYGKPLKALQQMENELAILTLQTIQHGIPELFADPKYVDFDAYQNSVAAPGKMYPMKIPPGQRAESAFYRNQPAVLSKEVHDFQSYIEARSQFVSGAFPAVFGGTQVGGSGTFSEYEMSRNQALQRLQILWKTLNDWYPRFMHKATKLFIKNMQEDETFVKPQGSGFVNEQIKKDDLSAGKLGEAFSESSEQFPVTWPQMRGMIMELLGMKTQFIDAALAHPENVGFMTKAFGMGGLVIPGSQDRDKELRIIAELLNSTPAEAPDPNFMPPDPNSPLVMEHPEILQQPPSMIPVSSVPVNNDIDNHAVCIATIQHWGVSEAGIAAQKSNPTGFENVMLHLREHIAALQMKSMPPQGPGAGPGGPQDGMEGIPPVEEPPNDAAGL